MDENLNEARMVKEGLDKTSIIAMTDSTGVITYINSKFCEISCFQEEELLGKTHRIINSGHHGKEFFRQMWETISSGDIWRGEIKNRDKDGHQYWVDTTIIPFLSSAGVPYKYTSIRNVITPKKLMSDLLSLLVSTNHLESKTLYETLLIELCRILEMKCAIFSRKKSEETFEAVKVVFDDKVNENFEYDLSLNPCIETVNRDGFVIENDLQNKFPNCDFAKENSLNSYLGVPLKNNDGKTQGILCLMDTKSIKHPELYTQIINLAAARLKDELSRIKALKAMKESEAGMRGIFSSAVDGIIVLEEGGTILNINPSALKIFSACKKDAIGKKVSIFMPDLCRQAKNTLGFSIPSNGGETKGIDQKGIQFPVYVSYSTVKLEKKELHSLFVRNLTEQKKAEEKLENARKELTAQTLFNQRLSALAAMAGGIAHELNQPLSGIRIYAEMISNMVESERGLDSEKVSTTIEKVIKQVNRASKIIDHMREFSSDQTDEQHESTVLKLKDCVESSLDLVGQQLKNNGITFINEIDPDHEVKGNLHRLEQVFINLFTNAKDSINDKTFRIGEDRIIHVSSFISASKVEMLIRDTGSGIPESVRSSLFEPFVSSKVPGKGTGLGLPICIGILRDYNAEIELVKTSEEGTSFKLEFPRV